MPDKAAPSDHNGVEAIPITNGYVPESKKVVRSIRPLPDSAILDFKQKLAAVDFEHVVINLPINEMVSTYQNVTSSLVTSSFPEKRIVHYDDDKPWYNEQLRGLKRQRLREYSKHGMSSKYLQLHESYSLQVKEAIGKYKEKVKNEVFTL